MPKEVRLSKYLRATNFAKNTHQAVDAYKNSLTGGGKVAYVVLWTKEQLPNDKVMPTIGSGFKEFASENDEFRTLFEQAVAARSDIHATNQVLVPEFMRSPEAMMSQFYGFLKEKGVSELPSLNDDVYEIEFKDSAGDEALAWCYFK